jgi:hypothetical protein
MLVFLSILSVFLGVTTFFSVKYMLKFASIIMMLEDDLSDAAETHKNTAEILQRFSELQVYTDSPEIARKLQQCREALQVGSMDIEKLANTLTSRSKQKYIRFEETVKQQPLDSE